MKLESSDARNATAAETLSGSVLRSGRNGVSIWFSFGFVAPIRSTLPPYSSTTSLDY
jgi:hypothetical protein